MDILDQLHGAHWADASERLRLVNLAADEIERLRKANTRLAEIATDAVEWLPPASVNGPREQYQNEIKELTK